MFTKALALAALLTSVAAQSFSISTPASLVQCQPAAISWTGGTGPYILDVIPGGQVQAALIEEIAASLPGPSTTWTVNLATGQSITLKLTDSTGAIAYSSPDTIQSGSDSTCLNATATSALAAAGTASGNASSMMSSAVSSGNGTAIAGASTLVHTTSVAVSSSMTSTAATTPSTSATSMTSGSPTTAKPSSASVAASSAASPSSSGGAMATAAIELPALAVAALGGVLAFF